MHKPSLLTFGAAAAVLVLAGCGQKTPAPAASAPASAVAAGEAVSVPFAVAGPTSGGIAHIGKDVENGVRMALDEINATKPVIGGKAVTFKIVAEDDAGDPKQATAIAQKLCDSKAVAVVGHLQSGTSIPASRIYHDCGIPQITPSATNPDLTKSGYKNVFRLIANDNQLGAAVAEFAAKKEGVKTVAIVDDRTAFGQGLAAVFKQVAEKNGLQVVAHEFTSDKAVDFMPILTSIKTKKPDAILFGGLDSQAGPMLRQMEQLGLTTQKYFGGDGICTTELAKLSGGSKPLLNVVCAEGGASLTKMPGGLAWRERSEKAFPGQFQIYSPYTYDATMLIVDAMKRANSADPKVYLAQLAAADYAGVTSKISFDETGDMKNAPSTLYQYVDGKKKAMD